MKGLLAALLALPLTILAYLSLPIILLRDLVERLVARDVRAGSRFVVISPFRCRALTYYRAPFTGGFQCRLAKDDVLVAVHDKSLGFQVEESQTFEQEYLLEYKQDPEYSGYMLLVPAHCFLKRMRSLSERNET